MTFRQKAWIVEMFACGISESCLIRCRYCSCDWASLMAVWMAPVIRSFISLAADSVKVTTSSSSTFVPPFTFSMIR